MTSKPVRLERCVGNYKSAAIIGEKVGGDQGGEERDEEGEDRPWATN